MFKPRTTILLIAAVGLLFFVNLVLHPTQTLYSDTSDLLTFHLPYKHFRVQSWRETGETPLWCPYIFGGMPFAHDIGASVYYPLHYPLLLLPTDWLGAAMSWLVVLHVIAAGWCMYAYAWHRGLRGASAFIAAVGYMLAGKWMLHLLAGGHYNMSALAWLPLVLLWLEQAIEHRSLICATWAGAIFSLLILCAYPYLTLYAGLFVAIWTLGAALTSAGFLDGTGVRSRSRTLRAVAVWATFGMWTALVAVTLGAAQLLPSLEGAAQASRSAGVGLSIDYFIDGFRTIVNLVGAPISSEPNTWENRGGFGVLWLAVIVAVSFAGGARVRFEAGVLLGMLAFSLGAAALFQWLPGFRLFRLPSRMLLVAALPAALLAGRAVEAVTSTQGLSLLDRLRYRSVLTKIAACTLLVASAIALSFGFRDDMEVRFHPYWVGLLLTLPCAFALLTVAVPSKYPWYKHAWLAVLMLDIGVLSWPMVRVRPATEIYTPSACVQYLVERQGQLGRVIDYAPTGFSTNHTPLWPGLPAMVGVEPLRGFNPIDVRRYKEYLQFLANDDQPLQVLDGMFTGPLVGSFALKNQSLADLLGVRFLLQPADLPLQATVPDNAARASWRKVSEDEAPTTFDIISVQPGGRDCGMHTLPPYVIYENQNVLPRVFVVPEAALLPAPADILATLKNTDFRRTVLLDQVVPIDTPRTGTSFSSAIVKSYRPNRIELEVDEGAAGYLVLADVWFPGWNCNVDGQEVDVLRANYLFRAIALPAGAKRVVFTFEPASLWWGQRISVGALIAVALLTVLNLIRSHSRSEDKQQIQQESHAVAC